MLKNVCINNYGFSYIWQSQDVVDINMFVSVFKLHI